VTSTEQANGRSILETSVVTNHFVMEIKEGSELFEYRLPGIIEDDEKKKE
jgi:hypothetical protein